jgi:cytidylate kinase
VKFKYLAIEREFGSGGTEIAHRIEANTGIPCYGKQIVERAAKSLHMSVNEVQKYEESEIFLSEQSEIQKIAKHGNAIFLGHCAAEALKEEEGVIKIFIRCSDNRQKQARIIKEYGIEASEADAIREKFDKKRANYYHANTARKWKDFSNYDIVLDSAVLGIEGCAAALNGLLFC